MCFSFFLIQTYWTLLQVKGFYCHCCFSSGEEAVPQSVCVCLYSSEPDGRRTNDGETAAAVYIVKYYIKSSNDNGTNNSSIRISLCQNGSQPNYKPEPALYLYIYIVTTL